MVLSWDFDYHYTFLPRYYYLQITQIGMTFDHDFGYSFPLFPFLPKKEERRKREWFSKNRDQKSCLSNRSWRKIWIAWILTTTLVILFPLIEQKGMTFDHDFGYSFQMNSKNRDQKSCLSAWSILFPKILESKSQTF